MSMGKHSDGIHTFGIHTFGLVGAGCLPLLALAACGSPSSTSPMFDAGVDSAQALDAGHTDDHDAGSADTLTFGTTDRPAAIVLPSAHDATTALPLVVLLHGYRASANLQNVYLGMSQLAEAHSFYLLLPDGTEDVTGNRFWNAQPACCDFGGTGVDDVGYLTTLIDQAEAQLPIDRSRIYFFGHSNGGFMAYRMACEIGDRLAAIGVLAGGDFEGDDDCVPPRPVSVLHIHGTQDETVAYEGGVLGSAFVGAVAATERWAARADCDLSMASAGQPFDLDTAVAGPETTPTEFTIGCTNAAVARYTMEGSSHIPAVTRDGTGHVMTWLLARTAPVD